MPDNAHILLLDPSIIYLYVLEFLFFFYGFPCSSLLPFVPSSTFLFPCSAFLCRFIFDCPYTICFPVPLFFFHFSPPNPQPFYFPVSLSLSFSMDSDISALPLDCPILSLPILHCWSERAVSRFLCRFLVVLGLVASQFSLHSGLIQ